MAHQLELDGIEYDITWQHITPGEFENSIRVGRRRRRGLTWCRLSPTMLPEDSTVPLVDVEAMASCSMSDTFTKSEGRRRSLLRCAGLLMEQTGFTVEKWNDFLDQMTLLPVKWDVDFDPQSLRL